MSAKEGKGGRTGLGREQAGRRKGKEEQLGWFCSWARKEEEVIFLKRNSFPIFRVLKIDQIQILTSNNLALHSTKNSMLWH